MPPQSIYYLGYYDIPEKANRRNSVLAATNKMTYISDALNRAGFQVEFISISGADHVEKGSFTLLNKNIGLKLFTSLGAGRQIRRVLSRWFLQMNWFLHILFHIRKSDTVFVYHSLGYMRLIRWLKRIINFRMVLEVEEIYSDVIGAENTRCKELDFLQLADAYLFPTELLNELVNTSKKPYVIIDGTYQVEAPRNNCVFSEDPEHKKKHLLYAGTFDPRKGGGAAAAAAARFMPNAYHVHILGFGSDKDKEALGRIVSETNQAGGGTVTLDGLLSGEEYIRFVQSCDVGFSTQMPDAAFNNTSFPSKVLSYLANGLRVVSVRIPALERSAVNDLLYYYDGNDPKKIADAVMKIDWSKPYDSRVVIRELDKKFVKEVRELLNDQ